MTATASRSRAMLVASLVLNVFLVGALVGGAYRWETTRPALAPAAAHPRGLRAAAAELSDTRRLQLREALQRTRRANRPVILNAKEGRRAIVDALRAQPFDPAVLDAALTRTRTADVTLRAELERAIGQFAADLNGEERARLADAMDRRGPSR